MVQKKSRITDSGFNKPVVYHVKNRSEIAKKYHIGQTVSLEIKRREEEHGVCHIRIVDCVITEKYPFFFRCIDSRGLPHCVDYFEMDRLERKREVEMCTENAKNVEKS